MTAVIRRSPTLATRGIEAGIPRNTGADNISKGPMRPPLEPDERRALIARAAYFRAEKRGFAPGCELEDWLAAELEIDDLGD